MSSDDIKNKIIKWIKGQAREEITIPPEKTYKDKSKYNRKKKHKNKDLQDDY